MSAKEDQAKEEARLALYREITKVAAELEERTTPQVAAQALKELAEAFAFVSSPAQPH